MRLAFLGISLALAASAANAIPARDFNPSFFNALQTRDEPIVLVVTRSDCSACEAQVSSFQQLASKGRYRSVVILKIDVDKYPSMAKALGIRQDTMAIGFHGFKETRRLMGTLEPATQDRILASTLR
jgi:thiol-disulfide isomerase/thioredoxin